MAFLLMMLILAIPANAEDISFSVSITAEDASLRVNTDSKCSTDECRNFYEQFVRTVSSKDLSYEAYGVIDPINNMSVSTNMTAVHNPRVAISGVFYVENIAIGCNPLYENCSTCASGIYADSGVSDLKLDSTAATTSTSLVHGYLMQANSTTRGVAKAGFRKTTENLTSESIYEVRAKNTTIAGLVTCQRYPAGPVPEGKPAFCPWGSDSGTLTHPIFNANRNDNESVTQPYKTMRK